VQLHDSEGRELFSSRFCSEPAVRAGDSRNKTLLLPFVSSGRTTPSVTVRARRGWTVFSAPFVLYLWPEVHIGIHIYQHFQG